MACIESRILKILMKWSININLQNNNISKLIKDRHRFQSPNSSAWCSNEVCKLILQPINLTKMYPLPLVSQSNLCVIIMCWYSRTKQISSWQSKIHIVLVGFPFKFRARPSIHLCALHNHLRRDKKNNKPKWLAKNFLTILST